MRNEFTTRTEAESHRYNTWAGNPKGAAYNPARCAAIVPDSGRAPLFYQCSKKPGHGPDGLYCSTHNPGTGSEVWYYEGYRDDICEATATKSSEDFLWIDGRREKKSTQWRTYFPSREALIESMRNKARRKIEAAKLSIQQQTEVLRKLANIS